MHGDEQNPNSRVLNAGSKPMSLLGSIFVEINQLIFAILSRKSEKTLFFDGLSGFLQLGVVLETSNIAHVSPWVHTFLAKKDVFFKSG